MAILITVVDPRRDILARLDDEMRMAKTASGQKVRRAHLARSQAYEVSLQIVDCFWRSRLPYMAHESHAEPVEFRDLVKIRDEVEGGGIVRG